MFKLKNGKTLKWGTFAMMQYCERQAVDLSGLLEQLASLQLNIKTLVAMVYAASNGQWDEAGICDWIDENGGIFAKDGEVVDFVNYVLKNTVVNQSEPVEMAETDEKKSVSL
jgi:hypothetical protein